MQGNVPSLNWDPLIPVIENNRLMKSFKFHIFLESPTPELGKTHLRQFKLKVIIISHKSILNNNDLFYKFLPWMDKWHNLYQRTADTACLRYSIVRLVQHDVMADYTLRFLVYLPNIPWNLHCTKRRQRIVIIFT